MTLPSPPQPCEASAALPKHYMTGTTFSPGLHDKTERQTACYRQLSNAKLGDFNPSEAKPYGIKHFSLPTEAVSVAGMHVHSVYFPGTGSEQRHGEPLLLPVFTYTQNLSQTGYKIFLLVLNICLRSPSI